MDVTHDVRVRVLRATEVAALKEPLCPEPDVRLARVSFLLIPADFGD